MARYALLVLALGVVSALPSGGQARTQTRLAIPIVPQRALELVEAAGHVVNQHAPTAMAAFSSGDGRAFGWVAARSHQWKADVLPVPGEPEAPPLFLAVFHAFHTCESEGDHVYRMIAPAKGGEGWKLGPEIPETETLGLRIRSHNMDAAIDAPTRTISLRDTVALERAGSSPAIRDGAPVGLLRIGEDFRLRSFRQEGSAVGSPFTQAGGVIAFVPPASARFTIDLEYAGRLNHDNGDYIHEDEAVIASYWYAHIARLPATLTLTATAPPGWTTVAQGEPQDQRTNADGSQTTTWRNDLPVSYFTLDMGRYQVTSRQWKGRLLSAYTLQAGSELSSRQIEQTLDRLESSLAYYEATFGPFPYRRYSLVETHGPFNGALEAYSFATFGPHTLPEFVPHELSHTWWGGIVPCAYTRSMWNEAFANYSDDLYLRIAGGKAGQAANANAINQRRDLRKHGFQSYQAMPISRAFDTEDETHNAIGYQKGAEVLRVLEEQIGQPAMIAALRLFIAHHARGEAAEWPEFEAAVSQSAGQDYHWFFAQWLDRPGSLRLALDHVAVTNNPAGPQVTGRIIQTAPLYRARIPIAVELHTGQSIHTTIEITDSQTPFTIPISAPPDRIIVDPDALVPMEPIPSNGLNPLIYNFQ